MRAAAMTSIAVVLVSQLTMAVTARLADAAGDPVIAVAGDIACDPADADFNGGAGQNGRCDQLATVNLLTSRSLAAVLTVGDEQYDQATASQLAASYDPSWGKVKAITRPAPGNHEYQSGSAGGYYGYFGAAAGDPTKGYYSFDVGTWHIISLNSNCWAVGGCDTGSPQEQWLAADLAAHTNRCTLAYWHHPRFTSGPAGNDNRTAAFWSDLYAANADLVMDGHDHVYERFSPQTPSATADPVRGLRQFTVGTGGEERMSFVSVQPNSELRDGSSFGVMLLTLHDGGYDFQFVPAAGYSFTDSGSGTCHYVPDAPTSVTAAAGDGSAAVAWAAPVNPGSPALTSYVVTASPGGASVTVPGTSTAATVGGLANGTTYTFTVTAVNGVGSSAASTPSNPVTPSASSSTTSSTTTTSTSSTTTSTTTSTTAPKGKGRKPH